MTISADFFWSSSKGPIRVSGHICLQRTHLCQNHLGSASRPDFEAFKPLLPPHTHRFGLTPTSHHRQKAIQSPVDLSRSVQRILSAVLTLNALVLPHFLHVSTTDRIICVIGTYATSHTAVEPGSPTTRLCVHPAEHPVRVTRVPQPQVRKTSSKRRRIDELGAPGLVTRGAAK